MVGLKRSLLIVRWQVHDSRGVVGQIEEETDVVHGSVLLEVRLKEASGFHVDLKNNKHMFTHVTGI